MKLEARGLSLAYGRNRVIDGLDLTVPEGRVSALIGPNGCGKSTLLKGLGRILKPAEGAVLLDGRPIAELSTRAVALALGLLPQGPTAPEGLTVHALVAQGRYPHQGLFRRWSEDDERATRRALAITGLEALAGRPLDTLSGGQRQRAWIAMVLAQDTELLLLDEPTSFLDLGHQIEVLDLVAQLNSDEGRTVVMVLHDINQAFRYAHHLIVMKAGEVVARGDPERVITPELIQEVFGVPCRIVPDPVAGTPLCVPLAGRPGGRLGPGAARRHG